ncbi:MAG TPA: hypothetical protein VGD62_02145 [Acidobacteriaceae bacterium]
MASVWLALLLVSFGLTACGTSYYFGNRPLPPSKVLNRVLVAVQNPGRSSLQELDALYDIRHVYNGVALLPTISGFSGVLPVSIQNLPAEETGAVFSQGDGSLGIVNYSTDNMRLTYSSGQLGGIASGAFVTNNLTYVFAAQQQNHVVAVADSTAGTVFLNLPGVYRVSANPSGTIALAFLQNSDLVYSMVHLTSAQQTLAIGNPHFMGAQDCEPQNLPIYCAFPVNPGTAGFDRPAKAIFSADGSAAYVLNCGPECGGTAAGVTTVPITPAALNPNGIGPAGIALTAATRIAVPGGATNAIFNGNTLYVAGQQLLGDGLFSGQLSIINVLTNQVTGSYGISDGTHTKMLFADDNTLWIGSSLCESGERYKQVQAGNGSVPYGCLTMFNTATNAVTLVDAYKGDATGIAAITALHKIYVAEGGQVYIYSTTNGAALDNANVTVLGIATDVAYMDALTDDNNTTY